MGHNAQTLTPLPYSLQRHMQGRSALCPIPGASKQIALGRPPSLDLLRRRRGRVTTVKPVAAAVVRRRPGYYGAVRLPTLVHRRLAPVGFTARTAASSLPRPGMGSPSSCPESLRTCMGSTTARGPCASSFSDAQVESSAEGNGLDAPDKVISRLNTQPTRTPANACNTSLRTHRHGVGPVRGATALPYGSLIHYSPSATGASPPIPRNSVSLTVSCAVSIGLSSLLRRVLLQCSQELRSNLPAQLLEGLCVGPGLVVVASAVVRHSSVVVGRRVSRL